MEYFPSHTLGAEVNDKPMPVAKAVRYATDIAPTEPTQAVIKEKFMDRVYWTPKKMGAQTEEANVNAGLAAARQIVGFFERNERKYIVNA